MDHFHPSIVRRLVQFLYTGNYDDLDDNCGRSVPLVGQEVAQERPTDTAVSSTGNGHTETAGSQERSDPPPPASPTPKANVPPVLLGHIRMNCIGDYYQVENLVSKTNTIVEQLLHDHSTDSSWVESLPTVIEEAVQSTGDKKLLKVLADAVADNISAIVDMDTFRNLSALSDFAFHIIQDCAHKNRALTTELGAARRELDGSKAHTKMFKDHEERCRRLLSGKLQCRHCGPGFSSITETPGYILCCTRCFTKHFLDK